jgi:hypothetical protein
MLSFEEYNLIGYMLHSLSVHLIKAGCQSLYPNPDPPLRALAYLTTPKGTWECG